MQWSAAMRGMSVAGLHQEFWDGRYDRNREADLCVRSFHVKSLLFVGHEKPSRVLLGCLVSHAAVAENNMCNMCIMA